MDLQIAIVTGAFSIASAIVAWLVSRAKAQAETEKIDVEKDALLVDTVTKASQELLKSYKEQAEAAHLQSMAYRQRIEEQEAELQLMDTLLLKFQMAFRIVYTQLKALKATPLVYFTEDNEVFEEATKEKASLSRLRSIYLDISNAS